MANQAFSEASDLMVGAGGLYFRRFDDENQLHFLGNCTEFNVTTDVTTVEKYSSMNKKRELMASVTTQTQASFSAVLNEYNMYNLALGLYGTEGVHIQTGTTLVNESYVVPSVPGIIELKDANGNRYVNVTSVAVAPVSAVLPDAYFTPGSDTWTDTGGGTVQVNGTGYTGSNNATFVFRITHSGTPTPGDFDGYTIEAASNALDLNLMSGTYVSMTGMPGSQILTVTVAGVTINFTLGTNATFTTPSNIITFTVIAGLNVYKEGKDFVLEEESIRGGLIKIKKGGSIKAGDTVLVSATVPDATYVTVSGSAAGKIEGELLFLGDPNQGNALMIEAWKCSVRPDGDLTGLIGDDFGEFTLTGNIMSAYEDHPDYPLYKVTKLAENTEGSGKNGVYDPNE